jgi:hypothetical protein
MLLKVLAAVGAVVIVVVGIGVYAVASSAASADAAQASASRLLKAIDSDATQIDKTLLMPKIPDIRANHPDFSGAKQTFDAHLAQIDQTTSTVAADHAKLRSTRDTLRAHRANLLALPAHSALDRELTRVASMSSALDEADVALVTERDQSRTLSALWDALVDANTLFDRLNKSDYVGAIAMFSGVEYKLQSAADLARSGKVPIQVNLLISAIRGFLVDLQGLFQAYDRNDMGAVKSLTAKFDVDARALNNVEVDKIDSFGQALVTPHLDLYHASLRAAGFLPVVSG